MNYSKYNSTKNLKITYLFGAGASFNSIPIWKAQGQSMINVAESILSKIILQKIGDIEKFESLVNDNNLINFFSKLKQFGQYAVEYGSIDIYARRLFLIGNYTELNELKHTLSVYFDLWENFLHKHHNLQDINFFDLGKQSQRIPYEKIDKRYFSLLSVLLEKSESEFPKLNENISVLTWNYDLQFENAFETFLPRKSISLEDTNKYLNFMNLDNYEDKKQIIHLNGFRGYFTEDNKIYETVEKYKSNSTEEYLKRLSENLKDFKNDYSNCIKYAWESNSGSIENSKKIISETNILVIIGYSFPAFNRKIDSELIRAFENGTGYKKVYYQDPYANQDLIHSLFETEGIVDIIDNSTQFHIPYQFLSPSSPDFTA